MDNCMLAETTDDISSALYYCDGALSCLKEAMAHKELNSKALAYVQKKHNSCLLKSRTLQKRTPASRQESHSSGMGSDVASVGNRSSITSSDSDMSDQFNRQPRPDSRGGAHQHRSHPSQDSSSSRSMHERQHSATRQGGETKHERQHSASRQGGENMHERQHSASRQGRDSSRHGQVVDRRNDGRRDSSVSRMQRVNPVLSESGPDHHRTESGGGGHVPQPHPTSYVQGGNSSGGESGGSGADLYGTLPRNKSRKPTSDAQTSAEVYQSFLNKQKCLQAGVTSSQQSLDSIKSDSGSDHSATGSGQNVRQWQQSSSGQQYPPQTSCVQYGHQQDVRQFAGPASQRPAQGGQYPQSGPSSWQQQQQQQQQYHPHQAAHPQHLAHQHRNISSYPHPHQQRQQPPAGLQRPVHSPHPTQAAPALGGAPHPTHPSLNYPPAPGKVRMPAGQGHPHQDPSESSNERRHTLDGSTVLQRPAETHDGASSETENAAVSVRALASRFENTGLGKPRVGESRPCRRHGSMKSDNQDRPSGVHRTRSKSESFSRKPKSVLKNKKNKSRPRKSVTFADSLAHYANCDDPNSGYESARELSSPRVTLDDRAYYSDDDERLGSHVSYSDNELDDMEDTGSSNSDESPLGEEDACQLCHKRRTEPGKRFCGKCSFYMGRLNPS